MGSQGTATLDFGAFPGASDASVAVTGQAGIVAGSLVEAWLLPALTVDHTADEHLVETLKVMAGNIVAATGFTVYGVNTGQLNEPVAEGWAEARVSGPQGNIRPAIGGGQGTRLYGKWNCAWVWN